MEQDVPDWIDDLKERGEVAEQRQLTREREAARRKELLAERLAQLLPELFAALRSDVEKLQLTFPDETKYHLDVTQHELTLKIENRSGLYRGVFQLIWTPPPNRSIIGSIDVRDPNSVRPQRQDLSFRPLIDDNDQFGVEFERETRRGPKQLSEALIKSFFRAIHIELHQPR
jgi:hypothetical protein